MILRIRIKQNFGKESLNKDHILQRVPLDARGRDPYVRDPAPLIVEVGDDHTDFR